MTDTLLLGQTLASFSDCQSSYCGCNLNIGYSIPDGSSPLLSAASVTNLFSAPEVNENISENMVTEMMRYSPHGGLSKLK